MVTKTLTKSLLVFSGKVFCIHARRILKFAGVLIPLTSCRWQLQRMAKLEIVPYKLSVQSVEMYGT